MNSFNGLGRITKELDLKRSKDDVAVLRFTIAIQRDKETSDFIQCVAFKKVAETISKYFNKGDMVGISGSLQTSSFEKDGKKQYSWEVAVSKISFPGTTKKLEKQEGVESETHIEDDEDIPFS